MWMVVMLFQDDMGFFVSDQYLYFQRQCFSYQSVIQIDIDQFFIESNLGWFGDVVIVCIIYIFFEFGNN